MYLLLTIMPITMNKNRPELISYLTLRKTVGILGIALPFILIIGSMMFGDCKEVQKSISAYYHTGMRDVFVGIICTIALFLFAYKGYDRKDTIASSLASVFALCVAFFPTSVSGPFTSCITGPFDNGTTPAIHFGSAGLLFIILSYFSLCLFTRKKDPVTRRKLIRNKFYKVFGFGMLVCLVLIGLYYFYLEDQLISLQKYDPIFWLETLTMWFFGASWLIKGETILTDPETEIQTNS